MKKKTLTNTDAGSRSENEEELVIFFFKKKKKKIGSDGIDISYHSNPFSEIMENDLPGFENFDSPEEDYYNEEEEEEEIVSFTKKDYKIARDEKFTNILKNDAETFYKDFKNLKNEKNWTIVSSDCSTFMT
jgi:hypothetical protein